MAQQKYSIDLQNTSFPMLFEQKKRTIIGSTAGEAPARDDKPGIAYCHNVMPSAYGFNSIGYLSVIPAVELPAGESFVDVRIVYGNNRTRLYLAWTTAGTIYSLRPGSTAWALTPITTPMPTGTGFNSEAITIGTVNGISYIYYANLRGYVYDESTSSLTDITLIGLSAADVICLTASSGYLIAFTKQAVAWSSTISPLDFVPSTITGAGGGDVAGIAGEILFATPTTIGVLIFTTANIIAATYTGNVQFPFKFREVEGSEGGLSLDKVAYEANGSNQYAFSKAGLQAINSQKAIGILPEVTDFLAGRRFEDFDEVTNSFVTTDLSYSSTMKKKIKFIASRYLVISYGLTSFTHALVYDLTLEKLGKLKITHVDCFEYIGAQTEIAKEAIAFLLPEGEVRVLDFSVTAPNSSGVALFGKLQATRTRMITLQEVEVENVQSGDSLLVATEAALDGKNTSFVPGVESYTSSDLRVYAFRNTAKNHTLLFKGKFNLTVVQVNYVTAGRR